MRPTSKVGRTCRRDQPRGQAPSNLGSIELPAPSREVSTQRAGPANYVGSLMDYNARFFFPALGRFVSADTIVQCLNRYMHVRNSSLSRIDPTGHNDELANLAWMLVGALDGWAEANMLGLGRNGVGQVYDALSVQRDYYAVGSVFGNTVTILTGWLEMEVGAGGVAGGAVLCPETIGGGCAVACDRRRRHICPRSHRRAIRLRACNQECSTGNIGCNDTKHK